jgi:hypothetical protein
MAYLVKDRYNRMCNMVNLLRDLDLISRATAQFSLIFYR